MVTKHILNFLIFIGLGFTTSSTLKSKHKEDRTTRTISGTSQASFDDEPARAISGISLVDPTELEAELEFEDQVLSEEEILQISKTVTPQGLLERSIWRFNPDGVVAALKDGANPNIRVKGVGPNALIRSQTGLTPLMRIFAKFNINSLSKKWNYYGSHQYQKVIATIKALLEHGADPHLLTLEGNDLRFFAEQHPGNVKIMEELIPQLKQKPKTMFERLRDLFK